MASSGDYSFNPSTYAIITGAMRLISAIQSGEAPPAEEYEDALASLNGVIHAWQTNGLHVWTQSTIDVPLVAGQASYEIGIGSADLPTIPRPLKITEGRLILGSDEEPLIAMSRWDYANLSNKLSPHGPPVQYFYDPQLPYGVLTVYPTPAITGTCRFIGQRPLQTFDTQRDTADIPQEWVSALRFSLAVELGPEYDVPAERLKIVKELADEKLKVVQGWDTEQQGTTTLPFSQPVYQLIAGALRLCGGCGAQDTPSLGLINNGFYSLNALVQQWQGMDIRLWTEADAILLLRPGQTRYLIGPGSPDQVYLSKDWNDSMWPAGPFPTTPLPRPLKVPAARRYMIPPPGGHGIETPLAVQSRIDYAFTPNKTTPGMPTQFFFDPQLGMAVISIWPAPADTMTAIKFTCQLPLTTYADLTTADNFPDEWQNAIRYNLAVELWPEHAERRAAIKGDYNIQLVKGLADEKLMIARAWDKEPESVYFGLQQYSDVRNT
jgi:hypothetical protein